MEGFMKDMEEVARFAVPAPPSPVELDRLCADFEEKVRVAEQAAAGRMMGGGCIC
jgi:hypothetical protein